jgi:CO/xanthine dehydrogenase Mo-binding subunit
MTQVISAREPSRVGGAFGLKQPPFQEEPLLTYLAQKLRRPVKWIEERDENFQATGHSRDVKFYYDVAFDDGGVVDAIDIRVIADVGAPTALLGWGQSFVTGYCLPATRSRTRASSFRGRFTQEVSRFDYSFRPTVRWRYTPAIDHDGKLSRGHPD